MVFLFSLCSQPYLTKAVRIMKLTAFILLISCLHVFAKGYSQESVTLNENGATLASVFEKIKQQTGMIFWFRSDQLERAKPVTIRLEKATITEALDKIFQGQPLTYTIKEKSVFVKTREEPIKNSIPNPPVDIRGRVVNERGDPVEGVTVRIKGSDKLTVTDNNGEFSLITVDKDAVIVFTHVSMESFEIRVTDKTELNIRLKSKISALDELQVIAYGTTTKRMNTGNVTSVKSADIQRQPVNNPLLALQGRVPGLFITQNRGFAGGAVTVRIQGENSLRSGNEPLYVVDGVPYVSQLLTTGLNAFVLGVSESVNAGSSAGNPLNNINPADIESIEVLKDADATAIYGSRAANGAILISTKRGKAGQTKVDINVQGGWAQVGRKVDLLNTEQYLMMRKEALTNDGLSPNPKRDYDLTQWDQNKYTDWQKKLIGNTAHYKDVQASVSGGNNQMQFLIGSGYHRETTVYPGNSANERGSLHFNLNNVSSNQKFRIQLLGNYVVSKNQLPADNDLTYQAMTLAPNAPDLYLPDGSINWAPSSLGRSTWNNPLLYTKRKYTNKTNNLIANAVVSYQLLPQLEIKSNFGYTNVLSKETGIYPIAALKPENRLTSQRYALYATNIMNSWVVEPQAQFKSQLWKGKIDALVGFTIQQNNNDGQQLFGTGYNSDLVLDDILSAATVTVFATDRNTYKYNALFSRINYNVKNKYLINLSARRDGSSRFGSGNKFKNFGAVGAAWIFSEEALVKNKFKFLSFGKLKSSYGVTGNDQIGNYKYLDLYTPPANIGVAYQGVTSLSLTELPNANIQWEETKKFNAGLDLGFISDRILFSFNYALNRSSNQLISYPLPINAGRASVLKNLDATVENRSLEFSLNTVNIRSKNITWTSGINLTIPKNKLISFENLATSSYNSTFVIGYPTNIVKVYDYQKIDPATGLFYFRSSGGTLTTAPDFGNDLTVIINPNPKFYGGFQNSVTYKSFQLDFLFQFVKQIGPNYIFGAPNSPGYFNTNQPTTVLDRWQKPGDGSSHPLFTSTFDYSENLASITQSNAYYSDASYTRLKNLSLSWNANPSLLSKVHIKSGRLYVQGQNLITITNYTGLDPETLSSSVLPPLRTVVLGVQIGL